MIVTGTFERQYIRCRCFGADLGTLWEVYLTGKCTRLNGVEILIDVTVGESWIIMVKYFWKWRFDVNGEQEDYIQKTKRLFKHT